MIIKIFYLLLCGFILVVPFSPEGELFEFESYSAVVFLSLLVIGLFWCGIKKQDNIHVRQNDVIFCLFLIYGLIHCTFLSDYWNVHLLCKWACLVLFYFLIRNVEPQKQELVLCPVLLSGIIQSIYGILQFSGFFTSGHHYFQVTGSFSNPGPYGGYLAVSWVAGWMILIKKAYPTPLHVLILVGMGSILFALFLSDSRAAWFAALVPVSIHFVWSICKRRNRRLVFSATVLFLAVIALFLYRYRPESADSRIEIWKVCQGIISDKPWIGHGPGSLPALYMPAQAKYLERNPEAVRMLSSGNNTYSFNEFLHLHCEWGIIGMILFLSFIFNAFPGTRSSGQTIAGYGLLSLLIFSCFSYPVNQIPLFLFFGLFFGLLPGRDIQCVRYPGRWMKAVLFATGFFSL